MNYFLQERSSKRSFEIYGRFDSFQLLSPSNGAIAYLWSNVKQFTTENKYKFRSFLLNSPTFDLLILTEDIASLSKHPYQFSTIITLFYSRKVDVRALAPLLFDASYSNGTECLSIIRNSGNKAPRNGIKVPSSGDPSLIACFISL